MSNEAQQAEAPEAITMESLFPSGKIEKQPDLEAVKAQPEEEQSSNGEDLAEAQETEESEVVDESPEAAIGRMRLKEFLDAAGVSMEEFYRDVYVEKDGKEVSISEAWDQHKQIKEANDALLRERAELQKRLDQSATTVPQQQVSPEASALMAQAHIYGKQLEQIMQDPNLAADPTAANRKVDLQFAINGLVAQAQTKQAEWNAKRQEGVQKALDEIDRQTRSSIPEWNDANTQASEWRAISDMMTGYGAQNTDIKTFSPWQRRLLRDAWRAMNQAKRAAEGAKRIRKVSKTLPAASRVPMKSKPSKEEARETIRSAKTRDDKLKAMLSVDLGELGGRK